MNNSITWILVFDKVTQKLPSSGPEFKCKSICVYRSAALVNVLSNNVKLGGKTHKTKNREQPIQPDSDNQ